MPENWFFTADLFDRFLADGAGIDVVAPEFSSYGGRSRYCGEIETITCNGDGAPGLLEILSERGNGRVLVADAGANPAWAVLGDRLAARGIENGWSGVLLNGYVRDSRYLSSLDLGVHALGTVPSRPRQFGAVNRGLPITFGGVRFVPGSWLYADEDGIVVCRERQVELPGREDSCAT